MWRVSVLMKKSAQCTSAHEILAIAAEDIDISNGLSNAFHFSGMHHFG